MGGCSKDTVERGCLFSWCDLQKGEPQGLEAGRSLSPLWVEYEGATGERALGGHRRGLAVARKEVLEGEAGKTPQVRERFPCRLKTRCCRRWPEDVFHLTDPCNFFLNVSVTSC